MAFDLIITPEAERDIETAFEWYDTRSSALGSEFIRELDRCFGQIQQFPQASPAIYRDIRRKQVKRFPYGLFYRILDSQIAVIACFHAKQDPQQWQRRT
ncbi:MAG: type II toxin-antitoxin system RelE/ParE family toxin [Geitlerinemataceae cyanobacterium]